MRPECPPSSPWILHTDRAPLDMAKIWLTYAWADNTHQDVDFVAQELTRYGLSVQLDRFSDLGWELLVELHQQAGDNSAAERARQEHAQAQAELESAVT